MDALAEGLGRERERRGKGEEREGGKGRKGVRMKEEGKGRAGGGRSNTKQNIVSGLTLNFVKTNRRWRKWGRGERSRGDTV